MSSDKLPPPEKEVRKDLWATMTLNQLRNQQDLILNKMSLLATMAGPLSPPHIQQLYKSLQIAYAELSKIIDDKTA